VSKAFALEKLIEQRGITVDQVVAFGDMPNDIPMLTWAGLGVAVANAHEETKAVADEITLSNDDDGVAIVIERLLLDSH
jgi:hydroxymethylpyrimidine pyrophosphatase-like HAD family hydrolase